MSRDLISFLDYKVRVNTNECMDNSRIEENTGV